MPHGLYSSGGYVRSEPWYALRPRRPGTYPGILGFGGAGGTELWASSSASPQVGWVFKNIIEDLGFVFMGPDGSVDWSVDGSHTWGIDEAGDTYRNGMLMAREQLGMNDQPLLLWAGSMGCISAINFWRRFPEDVRGFIFAPAAFDIEYHRQGDDPSKGWYQTNIHAAYGEGFPTSGAVNYESASHLHNPAEFLDDPHPGMPPMRIYHAENDPVSPIALVQDLASRAGASLITFPTGGHGDIYSQIDVGEFKNWIRNNVL